MRAANQADAFTEWYSSLPETPEVAPWIGRLGRIGHWAKGIVYLIIGGLGFQLAIGTGGHIAGTRGAMREIGQQPWGRVLLGVMAGGLLAYTAWRWVQAWQDTEGVGSRWKGITLRAGFAISGLLYLALGVFAAGLAVTGAHDPWGRSGAAGSASLLHTAPGRAALVATAGVLIALALGFAYQAYQAKFMRHYAITAMGQRMARVALHVGRIGITTRGVAFALIGWFILWSALHRGGNEPIHGIADALAFVAAQAHGKVLLGISSFGVICFGLHTMLLGTYRHFRIMGR